MVARKWVYRMALTMGLGLAFLGSARTANAQDWSRYYHWPHGGNATFQWSPYEYAPVYDGAYRYPREKRVYPTRHGYRDWSAVKKPYYRGYHFILDRF